MSKIELLIDTIPFDRPFRLEGEPALVVIRTVDMIRVFVDRCPHAHWPLSDGEFKDGVLQCIGHGWEFEIQTGHCLTVPVCNLRPLPIQVQEDRLSIELE